MPRLIDLTGKKFGRLLVLGRVKPPEHVKRKELPYWGCLCDCGVYKVILGDSLRNGGSISCGCFQKENISKKNFIDLAGKRFGKLTVIKRVPKPEHIAGKEVHWLCKCDCGSESIVRRSSLTSGATSSCGCILRTKGGITAKDENGNLDPQVELWYSAKRRAQDLSLPFSIEIEDIAIPDYCPVLGIKLCRGDGHIAETSPTLDRIIPELGYVPGNIAVISNRANRLKSDASINELEKILSWILSETKTKAS